MVFTDLSGYKILFADALQCFGDIDTYRQSLGKADLRLQASYINGKELWLHMEHISPSSDSNIPSSNMTTPKNQAAWLTKPGSPLEVGDAPMPTAGPGEIIVKNAAIAINPLDCHMQDSSVFIQQWPACIGCDVAGEVLEVGAGVERFKKGHRVIGSISLTRQLARFLD